MAVRIGFIGTGGIAGYHFNHLEKINDAKVVAVCDITEERVKNAAARFNATPYADYREMYKNEKLDAVYICVPPFAHGDQELLAVKKGIPIFVEKPIHLNLAEAKKIASQIEKKKLISAVGYQDRFQDIIDKLQKYLKDKQVGMIMGYWMGGMPGVAWWRVKAQSGGQAVEQTTHIFDMARYLFGDVEKVFAGGVTGLMKDVPNYDIEDSSAVTLFFKSGLVGVIFSACYLSHGGKCGIDIFCKDSTINYVERQSITISDAKGSQTIRVGNDFGLIEDKTFINAVKTGNPSKIRSTYPDAVKSVALSLAANESMETGQAVKVTV